MIAMMTSGRRFARQPAQEQIDGHEFVRAASGQAVGARQVDDFAAASPAMLGPFQFDGDARIIADAMPQTRQRVEESCLARVRVADQRDS